MSQFNSQGSPGSNNASPALLAAAGLGLFSAVAALALWLRQPSSLPPTCGALSVRQAVAEQLGGLPIVAWRDIRITGSDLRHGRRLCRATVVLTDGQQQLLCYDLRRDDPAGGEWHTRLLISRAR